MAVVCVFARARALVARTGGQFRRPLLDRRGASLWPKGGPLVRAFGVLFNLALTDAVLPCVGGFFQRATAEGRFDVLISFVCVVSLGDLLDSQLDRTLSKSRGLAIVCQLSAPRLFLQRGRMAVYLPPMFFVRSQETAEKHVSTQPPGGFVIWPSPTLKVLGPVVLRPS